MGTMGVGGLSHGPQRIVCDWTSVWEAKGKCMCVCVCGGQKNVCVVWCEACVCEAVSVDISKHWCMC